jgi:hypothetical protein
LRDEVAAQQLSRIARWIRAIRAGITENVRHGFPHRLKIETVLFGANRSDSIRLGIRLGPRVLATHRRDWRSGTQPSLQWPRLRQIRKGRESGH